MNIYLEFLRRVCDRTRRFSNLAQADCGELNENVETLFRFSIWFCRSAGLAQRLPEFERFVGYSYCDYRRFWYYSCTLVPLTKSLRRIRVSAAWTWKWLSRSRVARWGPYALKKLRTSSHALYVEVSHAPGLPQHGGRLCEIRGCPRDVRSHDRRVSAELVISLK